MLKEVKLKEYEEVLMAAFEFDADDLAANETGNYGERQIAALQRQRTRHLINGGIMGTILLLFLLFVWLTSNPITYPFIGLAIVGLLLLIKSVASNVQRINHDLQAQVSTTEGRIVQELRSTEDGGAYFVRLEEHKFKVKRDAFLAFKNGDPYRLYYSPHTKTILSVKWLRDDNPFEDQSAHRFEETPLKIDTSEEVLHSPAETNPLRRNALRG